MGEGVDPGEGVCEGVCEGAKGSKKECRVVQPVPCYVPCPALATPKLTPGGDIRGVSGTGADTTGGIMLDALLGVPGGGDSLGAGGLIAGAGGADAVLQCRGAADGESPA